MPPTKKKKKGGKKKAVTKKDSSALGEDDKVKQAQRQMELLRTSLAEARDETRRTSSKMMTVSGDLQMKTVALSTQEESTRDITSDLTRQYKLMQSQLMSKILDLQEVNRVLQDRLEVTQRSLQDTRIQAEKTLREKEDMIAQLTQRIQSMESAYESVLNEALDAMASKVETARDKWEVESYVVQQRNKDVLMEFGLSHVAL
eukprot:m.136364 g.136364  ORF g.136364 m.136364 type:complete len:202 (-) comp10638_c0_seq1:225-830(-)